MRQVPSWHVRAITDSLMQRMGKQLPALPAEAWQRLQ
jgi:hypothetical protein